jgi:hypothetical protein
MSLEEPISNIFILEKKLIKAKLNKKIPSACTDVLEKKIKNFQKNEILIF